MSNRKWEKRGAPNRKGIGVDLLQRQLRNSRIFLFSKSIGKLSADLLQYIKSTEDWHIALLQKIKRPYVIQSSGMILMRMGENNSIQTVNSLPKHLLPEIGASIHNNTILAVSDMNGSPQTFIAEIHRCTNSTGAANNRHSLRGSGTKKGYFHPERRLVQFTHAHF